MADCMCASRLRQQVVLQSVTATRDRIGGLVESWATTATVRAEVRQASGREVWYRGQLAAQAGWTITIRHRAGITTKMRVVYGGRTFEVRMARDPDERRQWIELTCDEVAAP